MHPLAHMCARASALQFAYVSRLLLLHGRAAYKRNCEVVWYSFHKNWMYNLTLLYYGFVTGACLASSRRAGLPCACAVAHPPRRRQQRD